MATPATLGAPASRSTSFQLARPEQEEVALGWSQPWAFYKLMSRLCPVQPCQKPLGTKFPKPLETGRAAPGHQQIPARVSRPWGTPHGGCSQAEADARLLHPPTAQRFLHRVPEPCSSRRQQEVQRVVGTGPRSLCSPGKESWNAEENAHPQLGYTARAPHCPASCSHHRTKVWVPSTAFALFPPQPCSPALPLLSEQVLREAGQVVMEQLKCLMRLFVFSFFLLSRSRL